MNTTLFLLLAVPVIVPVVLKFAFDKFLTERRGDNAHEWAMVAIAVGVGILLTLATFYLGKAGRTWDTEILNGQVTGKNSERVSCEHSYSCNCRQVCSGSGSSRSCSTHCDTCYEHSYDIDWNVQTTVGELTIDRVDRQGTKQPPRWTVVQSGQPVAKPHSYTNYVKAVPESVFHFVSADTKQKFASLIPQYPIDIYDYHYVDRVLAVKTSIPDIKVWNSDLALMLRNLGPQKQANIVIVFVNATDPTYEYALRDAWVGGKKNDIIVIVGTTAYPNIDWVRIISWSSNQLFNVKLRDDLQELGKVDRIPFMQIVQDNTTQLFKRKSMKEFKYLDAEIDPPTWAIVMLLVVLIGGNVGLWAVIYYEHKKSNSMLLGGSRYYRRSSR